MKLCIVGGGDLSLIVTRLILEYSTIDLDFITCQRHSQAILKSDISLQSGLEELGITPFVAESLDNEKCQKILTEADLAISFASSWIFKDRHLSIQRELYNVHLTHLPFFAGGAAASWQIMTSYRRGATTIHRVDKGIDTGTFVIQDVYDWPDYVRTPSDVIDLAVEKAYPVVVDFILKINGRETQQIEHACDNSFYFPRLDSSKNSFIDWSWDSLSIVRFINAFSNPYAGGTTRFGISNDLVFLSEPTLECCPFESHPFLAGIVTRIEGNKIFILTSDGMISCNYASSVQLRLGARLISKIKDLEEAQSFRAIYSAKGKTA